MVKRKQESPKNPSPNKKFNKNASLSAIDEVKSPKVRRKSLGSVNILQNVVVKPARAKTPKKKQDVVSMELADKFKIARETLDKAIGAFIKSLEDNPKVTKDLFAEAPLPLFLQINVMKIPHTHPQIIRIALPHPIVTPDHEVCLIVADVKGVPNKDHDKHLEHYNDLLRLRKAADTVHKIMTYHQFRTEYDTFEMKKKLVELYDCFLVDGRIAGKVTRKCGSTFYKKRKVPTPVKLQATCLAKQLDQAIGKVQLHVHSRGDSFVVQFGHSQMAVQSLVENVHSVLKALDQKFPGGYNNVRSMDIKSWRSAPIPIYLTTKNQNEVPVPVSKPKIPKACATVQEEISTRFNTQVVVDPFGNVKIRKVDMGEVDEEQQLQDEKRAQKKKLRIRKK